MIEAQPKTYVDLGPDDSPYLVQAWDDDGNALVHGGRGRLARADAYGAALREREREAAAVLAATAGGPRPF
jgi:hypothetical protein